MTIQIRKFKICKNSNIKEISPSHALINPRTKVGIFHAHLQTKMKDELYKSLDYNSNFKHKH